MKVSRSLHAVAFAIGLSTWLARRRPARRVIMFHGINEVDMPVEAFERNLRWLAARFDIIPLGDMVDGLQQGRAPSSRGELALTFDDGLSNHFEVAYPALLRLGLPATFFVCPELIDKRRWIWNQEARERLKTMDVEAMRDFARQSLAISSSDTEALVQRMKELPIDDRRRVEDDLRNRTATFEPDELQRRRFDPLTWSQVKGFDPRLITIGSHSLSHPILPTIDDASLERELRDSRRLLEQRLGHEIDLFCYPNGAQDERVHAAVARHYRAAVTTRYGLVPPTADVHRMLRIPATPSLPTLAWRMHRPAA